MKKFRWTTAKEQAALRLAEDKLTDEEIATEAGVSRAALALWKLENEFSARVQSHVDEFRRRVRRRGIAIIENRVAALDDRWKLMQRVIAERAEAAVMQDAAGGKTGLLCHTKKGVGAGPAAEVVDEFAVDTGLLKELREHEKQAAQELGQWVEKAQPVPPDVIDPGELDAEDEAELQAALDRIAERKRQKRGGTDRGPDPPPPGAPAAD